MTTCTRRIDFCAGHRVFNHEGKCALLHGHNYSCFVTCAPIANSLDPIGRVIDFSVIKKIVGSWITKYWDHKFILHRNDKEAIEAVAKINRIENVFLLAYNPTAENLARHIFDEFSLQLRERGVRIVKVEIQETPNCTAVYDGRGQ